MNEMNSQVILNTTQTSLSVLLIVETYAGRVACCPWRVMLSMLTRQTDRLTDARPLHFAFRYGRGQRNKHITQTVP